MTGSWCVGCIPFGTARNYTTAFVQQNRTAPGKFRVQKKVMASFMPAALHGGSHALLSPVLTGCLMPPRKETDGFL
jgi:hypothetical protein